jgi:hypothetical protein
MQGENSEAVWQEERDREVGDVMVLMCCHLCLSGQTEMRQVLPKH